MYPEKEDYERWIDIRKLFKRSVSLIIALAIGEYLDQLIEEPGSAEKPVGKDSYPSNYLFVARESVGLQKFVTYFDFAQHKYWGFPEAPLLEEFFT
ncbi:MAG: hypothetical protein GY754_34130 [bacterium]|nr:hypothetical protein [bacterium]